MVLYLHSRTWPTFPPTFSSQILDDKFFHFFCTFIATRRGLRWVLYRPVITNHWYSLFCIGVPITKSMLCLGVCRFCSQLNTCILFHHITIQWVFNNSSWCGHTKMFPALPLQLKLYLPSNRRKVWKCYCCLWKSCCFLTPTNNHSQLYAMYITNTLFIFLWWQLNIAYQLFGYNKYSQNSVQMNATWSQNWLKHALYYFI